MGAEFEELTEERQAAARREQFEAGDIKPNEVAPGVTCETHISEICELTQYFRTQADGTREGVEPWRPERFDGK